MRGAGACISRVMARRRGITSSLVLDRSLTRETGQMVVELCVVMPVVLMVAVVIIDGLVFAAAASKFDHLSSQAILAEATSPGGTEFDPDLMGANVQSLLAEEMEDSHVNIEVAVSGSGHACEFKCTMSFVPWPLGTSGTVMSMSVPALLEHGSVFCVRPYVIGEL